MTNRKSDGFFLLKFVYLLSMGGGKNKLHHCEEFDLYGEFLDTMLMIIKVVSAYCYKKVRF